ncbi:MAG: hypothetical protein KGI29_00240 [Pseudomonadota bacterium]|nr:hypothetical protein [Pseudomonadota bacterium]MDE3038436.1 hypothetical protein [Pseudomonadota bacterium]
MPFRNGKIAGVLNNSDSSTNEMSYVDMHDLHPDNVQAAQVHGAVDGAMSGATLAAIPAALMSFGTETVIEEGAEHLHFNLKNGKIGAAIIALGAVVMGAVRSFTAKKEAETHNAWSERVLSRMEQREAVEAEAKHAAAVITQREQAAQGTQQAGK